MGPAEKIGTLQTIEAAVKQERALGEFYREQRSRLGSRTGALHALAEAHLARTGVVFAAFLPVVTAVAGALLILGLVGCLVWLTGWGFTAYSWARSVWPWPPR